jgi:membrane associated rhomboid family serine protease
MGIYDRDYNRGYYPQSGFNLGGATTLTTKLVIVMFAVYVVQLLTQPSRPDFPGDEGWFTDLFSLYPDVLKHPLRYFQFLTYGFLHDPGDLKHIAFNMFGLWIFGRDVEYRYGRREYLSFIFVAIIVAGLAWVLSEFALHRGFASGPAMLGASGGVTAVVILFALNFPNRTLLFMFVLPMPMWVAAILFVGYDAYGAVQRSDNVAYTAHLGGALFAFIYFQSRWRLERFLPSGDLLERLKPKPKLRVVDPDSSDTSTDDQVDEILKKIQEHGRNSLTRQERRILEEASKQYQKKRR